LRDFLVAEGRRFLPSVENTPPPPKRRATRAAKKVRG